LLGLDLLHAERELGGDPRNAELLERSFVALLADGSLPEAFRAAEKLTRAAPRRSAPGVPRCADRPSPPRGSRWRRRPCRGTEKLTQRDGANGLAQLALGVQKIKAKQFAAARQNP
jgi:hypothetical protein